VTSTFARFPARLQDAIASRLGWTSLRPVQEEAGQAILDGKNAIVLAPTAGGKTEASMFPALANLLERPAEGVGVIYIAPIKALLNNQEERLGTYAEMVGLRRFVWHGDVAAPTRKKFLKDPAEILMTTPESLEVMLVSPSSPAEVLFRDLRLVVIDEVHAMSGTDRGAHLMSVLERLAPLSSNDVQRVGLSATVGNPKAILGWIKGTSRRDGVIVDPKKPPSKRNVHVGLYDSVSSLAGEAAARGAGKKSLFFCQSRRLTEGVAERMRGRGIDVFVHHSSVSLEERRAAEERFHKGLSEGEGNGACIVCTSTLELGIDVGDLDLVFQANAPSTVSSFLQRMGRTGRREGTTANTTFLCEESESVVQAVALIELARARWVEPVAVQTRCWPVLVHQLLAMTLQFGAISAERCRDQLSRVPDFSGIRREEFDAVVDHMKAEEYLFESGGLLSMGQKAERVFGRKNFMELYAVFSSPVLFRVETLAGRDIGSLEQTFVDRLVQDMSSFLLGGRAWTVAHVNLPDRVVQVREAPGGVKPSWGGYIPQHLSFDVCNRIKGVLAEDTVYPYVDEVAATHLQAQRDDLGELLRRKAPAIQLEGGQARWWTFAGGRINQTIKYGLEIAEGWKVVPDNFMVRIEGDGVNHDTVRAAIEKLGSRPFWRAPDTKRAVLARLPNYRLSKFQDCLPEPMALEMVAGYLLDIEGTIAWLAGGPPSRSHSSSGPGTPRVQLRLPGGDVREGLRPGLEGRWEALPDDLSVRDLEAVAHMVNGYKIGEQHLGLAETSAFDLAWATRDRWLATGEWTGTAVELLATFFCVVRGWRGLYVPPEDGDEHHVEAQSLYEAIRRRLREHPEEVELVPAATESES
jgi:ATP-dependent Lhr-like helicase